MSEPVYTCVLSGQSLSSPFALERSDKSVAVFVPSLSAASEVQLHFSQTSGSACVPLFCLDGSGKPCVVASGAGPFWGCLPIPPTPWGKVVLVGSQSDVRTFCLRALNA